VENLRLVGGFEGFVNHKVDEIDRISLNIAILPGKRSENSNLNREEKKKNGG
jgi:hypothetical protein